MVYTLWQPAVMEQFCADDRSKDIFHTSPMMHTFTYTEQQFLKWALMFCYKLAIPSDQYLIFSSVSLLVLQSNFSYGEGISHFSQGYIYILMKCGLSALPSVNLSFTAKQVTT